MRNPVVSYDEETQARYRSRHLDGLVYLDVQQLYLPLPIELLEKSDLAKQLIASLWLSKTMEWTLKWKWKS